MKSTDSMKFITERNYARADRFLKSLGFSHTHIRRAFLAHLVTAKGEVIFKSTPLEAHAAVAVAFADEETNLAPAPMKQKICYEDEDLLVIDKGVIPAMPCKMYPDHTLANEVWGYFQSKGIRRKVRMLGRLDKETDLALVKGKVKGAGTVDAPIGVGENSLVRVVRDDGQSAVTHYKPLHTGKVSLLEIKLDTGRTHQIRCHMAHLGHPVLGDELYGGGCGSVHLHVHRISIIHPRTNVPMIFTSPMPNEWTSYLNE